MLLQFERRYTADDRNRCYVESIRTVGLLLGLSNYLIDPVLAKFLRKFPAAADGGVTWALLTKLVQMCNVFS